MPWCKKALKHHIKEMIVGAIVSIIFSLILLLRVYALGEPFHWISIEPISQPSPFQKYFYSGFTFVTIGAFLYFIYLYKALKILCVDILNSWELYIGVKGIIWVGLYYISYQYLVPYTIDILNSLCSFLFNIFQLIFYLFPTLGISIIIYILYLYLYKKYLTRKVIAER